MNNELKIMHKNLKKLFIFFLIGLFVYSNIPEFALAQESTGSASVPTDAPTNAPFSSPTPVLQYATSSATIINTQIPQAQNPFEDQNNISTSPTPQITQMPPLSLFSDQQSLGPSVKQPPVVEKLGKHTFKENETVSLMVGNQAPGDIKVVVKGPDGQGIDPSAISESLSGVQTTISIDPSHFYFKPGKYSIQITDSTGKITTQDFTWGVLALNTNKSYYLSGDNADISIAVLDDKGDTVCNADVSLDIYSPSGSVTHLSTKDNTIVANQQCHSHNMSLTPDYETHYTVENIGNYPMTLTAITANGTNTISDNLDVVNSVPFDVERISATRLYPYNVYPMIFHIKANQDFTGKIVETVPANFQVSPYASGSAQTYSNSTLVLPIPDMNAEFGVSALNIGMPFNGKYPMVQGFGVAMTDPQEAPYYASFGLAGHDGLDFALSSGTPVIAVDDGTVSLAGDGAYGTTIVIDHTWGKSYYGHLSKLEVTVGQKVTRGQEIGLSGATGHVTGPHLHFGIKPMNANMQNGFYGKVDPSPYLDGYQQSPTLGIITSNVDKSQKQITWNENLKKGDSIAIAYSYQSPPQSPQFYTLGPLKFYSSSQAESPQTSVSNNNLIFQESRQWELAIDTDSTAGPNNCTSGANNNTASGLTGTPVAWATPGNACSSSTTTQAVNITSANSSQYLVATGFNFSLASNAVIHGIQFSITKSGTSAQGGHVSDSHVFLVKAGTIQTSGTDQLSGTNWPGTAAATTYGSSTTISWGGTWLYSDINSSGFGIAIVAIGSNGKNQTATITGDVTATISYNQPPTTPTGLSPSSTTSSSNVDFKMTATDPQSENVQYVISLYTPSTTCTGSPTTYDQGSSQAGWSGSTTTCTSPGDCYASGTQGDLNLNLSSGTNYSWTVAARDPQGSNTLSTATSCTSFSTPVGPTLDQLMRHGQWFNNSGVLQPFTF